jgi:hypothetical protein
MNLESICETYDNCETDDERKVVIDEALHWRKGLCDVDRKVFLAHCFSENQTKIKEYEKNINYFGNCIS